jgi:CheY-like chemotaxis protein
LHQVVLNLVDNAVKFTHQGSVTLRLAPTVELPHGVRLEVCDTGIGVPEAKRQEIFRGFVQADSSITRRYGGSGLGLAICHRLVEAMGGRMGVKGRPGGGCIFQVLLSLPPMLVPPTTESAIEERELTTGKDGGASILLVEDAKDNVFLIEVFLKRTPHRIRVAWDGQEAVELFKQGGFDLVLMDLQMPIKDGYTATREMRALEQTRHLPPTPIIALSAYAFAEDADRAREAGCDGFLTKPLAKKRLLATIDAVLRGEPVPDPATQG